MILKKSKHSSMQSFQHRREPRFMTSFSRRIKLGRPSWESVVSNFQVVRSREWPLQEPCSKRPKSCVSTRPLQRWIQKRRDLSNNQLMTLRRTPLQLLSLIDCQQSRSVTALSLSSMELLSSKVPMMNFSLSQTATTKVSGRSRQHL